MSFNRRVRPNDKDDYWVRRKDSGASTSTTASVTSAASSRSSSDDDEDFSSRNFSSGSVLSTSQQLMAGGVTGAVVAVFSTYFPFWIDPSPGHEASTTIYQHAGYSYDKNLSRFDNSFLTYGTDYGLALAMAWSAYRIVSSVNTTGNSDKPLSIESQLLSRHVWYSRGMLLTYLLSVLAGGLAHQFFTTLQDRNSMAFRLLWTVCVGSVTAASGFMGSIGGIWAEHDCLRLPQSKYMPVLREPFWIAYAAVVTAVMAAGVWSYQRPAADIFVCGITQFPSTFYVMGLLYLGLPTLSLSKMWRYCGLVAFILNAPLLPAYPLLCMYAKNLSLGQVNAILHSNLLLAWSGQGSVLRAVTDAWQAAYGPPPTAIIPVGNQIKRVHSD